MSEKTRQMSFTVLETGEIRADFGEGVEPVQFNPANLPESLYPQALGKGFIAGLTSATSKLSGEERTGASLRAAVAARLALYQSGVWSPVRESGPEEISIEAEAAHVFRIMRGEKLGKPYTGTVQESAAAFASLGESDLETLKGTALYKLAYAKVKAERQAAKVERMQRKAVESEEVNF